MSIDLMLKSLAGDRVTPAALGLLEPITPGQWRNPTSLLQLVMNEGATEQSAPAIAERAEAVFAASTRLQDALSIWHALDDRDPELSAEASGVPVGSLLDKVEAPTTKEAAIDAAMKLVGELLAMASLADVDPESLAMPDGVLAALGEAASADDVRLAAWIAIDGVLTLGDGFMETIGAACEDHQAVIESPVFERIADAIPGESVEQKCAHAFSFLEAAAPLINQFVSSHSLTQDAVQSAFANALAVEASSSNIAALLESTTDYFAHTGLQSVARVAAYEAYNQLEAGAPPPDAVPDYEPTIADANQDDTRGFAQQLEDLIPDEVEQYVPESTGGKILAGIAVTAGAIAATGGIGAIAAKILNGSRSDKVREGLQHTRDKRAKGAGKSGSDLIRDAFGADFGQDIAITTPKGKPAPGIGGKRSKKRPKRSAKVPGGAMGDLAAEKRGPAGGGGSTSTKSDRKRQLKLQKYRRLQEQKERAAELRRLEEEELSELEKLEEEPRDEKAREKEAEREARVERRRALRERRLERRRAKEEREEFEDDDEDPDLDAEREARRDARSRLREAQAQLRAARADLKETRDAQRGRRRKRLLRRGSKGDAVLQLQRELRDLGYPVKADGSFGKKTKKAVMDLQRAFDIKVDGIVGPQTRAVIAREAGAGTTATSQAPAKTRGAGKRKPPRAQPKAERRHIRGAKGKGRKASAKSPKSAKSAKSAKGRGKGKKF